MSSVTDNSARPSRLFHIGDVLSAMTGTLVSPRGIEGMYDLLGYMTGEPGLMTHQLPRASREVEPHLRAQFPDLATLTIPSEWPEGDRKTVVMDWLAEQVARYGEDRWVEPLAPDEHTHINPLDELAMMRPDLPVIGVVVADAKGSER